MSARSRYLWCAPILLWCAVAALFAARLGDWTSDDFYITYRYARNLAQGQGFVFNPGERVFGTTDPGLGLLLAALHFLTRLPVPLLGNLVFSACLVGIAATFLLEGWNRGHRVEPILGGSLLLISSYVWGNHGAAAPLAILLLLLSAKLSEHRRIVAGLLAGAAVWVRPDSAIGVALLAAVLLLQDKRVPWRFVLASGCVIAAGVVLAWLYFGSPLPNTIGAKADMAAATANSWSGARFWPRALVPIGRHFGAEWPLVLLCGAAGCWPLATRAGRPGLLLALFGLSIAVAYPLLGVPFFSWYILPCLIVAIYGLAFFAGRLAERAPSLRALIAVAIFVLLTFTTLRNGWTYFRHAEPVPRMQSYRRGAEWIKAHSDAGASIAYVEIGILGYYSERPILDLMGLVTPAARPYVLRNDLLGTLKASPTDFVVSHTRGRMTPIVTSRWFKRRYREVMRFEDPGGVREGALQIYQRRSVQHRPTRNLEE